ncbi:MAG: serine/threonine protein kinase [Candidatus Aureabacteria bacterium]|nr:serine/threonine protein kinase [Candidatus Auribacterota bacterium]
MDLTCQKCGAQLPQEPAAEKPAPCPECGYFFSPSDTVQKTISDQLAKLTVQMEPSAIEEALTVINTCFQDNILTSQNIGATIKTPAGRISRYASHVKRKTVEQYGKEKGSSDYSLIEKIGEGGMGVIYLAEQSSLKRNVALKMTKESGELTEARMENFLAEALITADFDHPNVVPIHDAGIDHQGRLFYIMKRVQGVTWESILHPKTEDEKKLSETYSLTDHLNILHSVCNAIAFAHSKDIIHRDIKPANVMIGEFGEVIVLDWGLAASIGSSKKVSALKELNTFGGTVSYMAPEMARAQSAQIGKHSDIYLLGATLYEILTGHPPHSGDTMREAIINAILNKIRPPEDEKDIDMILMETALKAMSRNPLQRYLSVSTFQRALKKYTQGKASHLGSIRFSRKATDILQKGIEKADIKMILRAEILFDRALSLWSGNREAELGKPRAEILLMKAAYECGEIDLLLALSSERSMRTDIKLLAEKEKYNAFRSKHPVISSVLSGDEVYHFLKKTEKTSLILSKKLNRSLKFLYMIILLILPVIFYWPGSPLSYIASFAALSIAAVIIGEIIWKKSAHTKKG